MIKRALSESGCPPHILDDLMENCHERRWPRGLSSLETRQNNRRIYDSYVCRRIPGGRVGHTSYISHTNASFRFCYLQANRRYWYWVVITRIWARTSWSNQVWWWSLPMALNRILGRIMDSCWYSFAFNNYGEDASCEILESISFPRSTRQGTCTLN